MKKFIFNLLRTSLMTGIATLILLFSGMIIDFFPAILKIPVIIFLFSTTMLYYFSISSYDILSTIFGIILSLLFVWCNIMNILIQFPNVIMVLAFIISTFFVIIQTLKCLQVRFENGFKDRI